MRINWGHFSREEKNEKDNLRTSHHNTFFSNLKSFHKLREKMKLNGNWLEKLGSSEARKCWGDFVGDVVYFENIKAR
ncbi:hypothetical protein IW510_11440 [Enterococcus sp. BWR-S5]|nr:hypothetical protein [Enterococcus sp. BWR-S5]